MYNIEADAKKGYWPKVSLIRKTRNLHRIYIKLTHEFVVLSFIIIGLKVLVFIDSLIFGQSTFFATVSIGIEKPYFF